MFTVGSMSWVFLAYAVHILMALAQAALCGFLLVSGLFNVLGFDPRIRFLSAFPLLPGSLTGHRTAIGTAKIALAAVLLLPWSFGAPWVLSGVALTVTAVLLAWLLRDSEARRTGFALLALALAGTVFAFYETSDPLDEGLSQGYAACQSLAENHPGEALHRPSKSIENHGRGDAILVSIRCLKRKLGPITLALLAHMQGRAESSGRTPDHHAPKVGEVPPDFTLTSADGSKTVRLSDFAGEKPVVLVFGSHSCPPHSAGLSLVRELYERYGDEAEFIHIYIEEAHPMEGWWLGETRTMRLLHDLFDSPASIRHHVHGSPFMRRHYAILMRSLFLGDMSIYTDTMNDRLARLYAAFPTRFYLVGKDGRVAWKSPFGPFGYDPSRLEDELEDYLASLEKPSRGGGIGRVQNARRASA